MGLDWSDGEYARTAATLEPAAAPVLDAAGVGAGTRVVDVGCGTGNAVLAAARRGAHASGADPSAGLLEQARARAQAEGLTVDLQVGEAAALPFPDGTFDAAVSVFAVIFAPDPAAALAGVHRVLRPAGTFALAIWLPGGAVQQWAAIMHGAVAGPPADDAPRWGEPAWVTERLGDAGFGDVTVAEHRLAFTGASPAAWLAEQERYHPFARMARRALDDERWEDARGRALVALTEHNEDPAAFLSTSAFAVLRGRT